MGSPIYPLSFEPILNIILNRLVKRYDVVLIQ